MDENTSIVSLFFSLSQYISRSTSTYRALNSEKNQNTDLIYVYNFFFFWREVLSRILRMIRRK